MGRDSQRIDEILRDLEHQDWRVRHAACRALGQLGDLRAVELLIARLGDGDPDVREAAYEALVQIGEPAVERLIRALGYWESWVRKAACEALGRIGKPAVEPLIRALGDRDSWVRKAACEALEALGEGRLARAVLGALEEEEKARNELALLAKEGDTRAVEPLIKALEDEKWPVRKAACEALGRIGDPRAVKPLIKALGDWESWVRKAACKALGRIGKPAVEPLIRALGDGNSDVREAACEALVQIGEPAVEPLIRALGDRNSDVRRPAGAALRRIWTLLKSVEQEILCSEHLTRCQPKKVQGWGGGPSDTSPAGFAGKVPQGFPVREKSWPCWTRG